MPCAFNIILNNSNDIGNEQWKCVESDMIFYTNKWMNESQSANAVVSTTLRRENKLPRDALLG